MRKVLLVPLLMIFAVPVGIAQDPGSDQDVATKLRFAASQHEIISMRLKEDDFSEALAEFSRILDLELTGKNEKPVVQEAWLIVDSLRKATEYALAHQVVDETLAVIEVPENRFYLLMLRGKIFQDEGLTDEAIETYRQAQQFNPDN